MILFPQQNCLDNVDNYLHFCAWNFYDFYGDIKFEGNKTCKKYLNQLISDKNIFRNKLNLHKSLTEKFFNYSKL